MYTNKYLLKEITAKWDVLNSGMSRKKLRRSLRKCKYEEGLRHSLGMSYPLDMDEFKTDRDKKKYLRSLKPHLKHLVKAYNYGSAKFRLPLTEKFLFDIENRIEPDLFNGNAHYRTMGVRPSGASTTPPYPAKIQSEMDKFLRFTKKAYNMIMKKHKYFCFPDLAALVHLHILRIHPFEDGNGRLARMLHNFILFEKGFPPIMIEQGEKVDYHSHLDDAVLGYEERKSKLKPVQKDSVRLLYRFNRGKISDGEKHFYDYVSSKLNVALDNVLGSKY